MITIVDYGMGNLGSIVNMLRYVDTRSIITSDVNVILNSEKIILPGVGSFDAAIENINSLGFRPTLDKKALEDKIPILGICLGMQLLTQSSEEGKLPGLGWLKAQTKRFPPSDNIKIPHMGWNTVKKSKESKLLRNLTDNSHFYFVHSYYVSVDDSEDSLLRTSHGIVFESAVERENIMGVQFHPEKSHHFGMTLLSNFAKL